MGAPIVAIVGRPNVGKSTLFNRIVGGRVAIVEPTPGVTRDRLAARAEWAGRSFLLIDTGGLDPHGDDPYTEAVGRQAAMAMEEADALVFVVDVRTGPLPADVEVAETLRRIGKPVIVAANKAESAEQRDAAWEFFSLGLGEPIPISAEHGYSVGDLLDAVVARLPESHDGIEADRIQVAVIGRPNVGKSSLVNRMLGAERVIVSPNPGATRDAIDTELEYNGRPFTLIDTAGIRRRARVAEAVEHYSVVRALRAVERCDVCILVLDGAEGVLEQDKRIAGLPHEAGKGVVIAVNKWDLVVKDAKTMNRFDELIRQELRHLAYAPIVYVSALTGQRVGKLLETAEYVAEQRALRISTGTVNECLQNAVARREPPAAKDGRRLRIYYGFQAKVNPPTFVLFVNDPELMHFSYRRYLENQFREAFGFVGAPIHFALRRRER